MQQRGVTHDTKLPDIDWTLIARYLDGEASPTDLARVEGWLKNDPALAADVARIQKGREAVTISAAPIVWRSRTDVLAQVLRSQPPVRRRGIGALTHHGPRTAFLSACLALLICAGLIQWNRTNVPKRAARIRHYATAPGRQGNITLPDGTRVTLGPATTMSATAPSNEAGTSVTVDGEALFTVVHHANAPFIVRAGGAHVRVLGTTFLVRRYAGDRATRIVVSDGRVAIRAEDAKREAVLGARSLGIITDSGNVTVTPNIAPDDFTALRTQQLVFRDTPANIVIDELNRAYDADIRLPDSALARRTLSITVPVHAQSLDNVLDALLLTLGAHAKRTGHVITILPGRPLPPMKSTHAFTPELQYGR